VNEAAFAQAVARVADVTRALVRERLITPAPPRSREEVAEQARERGRRREARFRARPFREPPGT